MKILILGGTGMLGSDCRIVLAKKHEVLAPSRKELDIVSWDRVIEMFDQIDPEVVLNCAAFTDVDACETEDFLVRKVNVEGPRNLAQCCARFECKLVHISSDYVFDGLKPLPQPYFEDDTPIPLSAYGKSKAESEVAIRENSPNYIIIRSGWLYGAGGPNFIRSIVRQAIRRGQLKVVDDQFGSPTWTYRLALQIESLLNYDGRGTYHATSEGYCSRFEYAQHVLRKLGLKASLEPCRVGDFQAPARRPLNCILENRLLRKQGINLMRHWRQDLDRFLEAHGADLMAEAEQEAA